MDNKNSRPRLIKVRTSPSTVCVDSTTSQLSRGATIPASPPLCNGDGSEIPVTLVSLAGKKSSWQGSSRRQTGSKLTKTNLATDLDENDHVTPPVQSSSNSVMSDFECELEWHSAGLNESKDMEQESLGQHQVDNIELSVNQEQETPEQTSEEEVSLILEWFREKFTSIGKHGRVTLKDFRHAAKEFEMFADNLFKLFDTDHSNSVSLQELVGGLGRLTTSGKKVKILEWFEQTFKQVSGEDQLLQIDEFKRALHIKGFLEKFYQLMDNDNNGRISIPQLIDALQKLTCLNRDAKWLAWFEQQFSSVAGSDRQIDLEEFKGALHVKQSFFAERFFQLFDRDGSGYISLMELMDGLTLLTNGTEFDKLRFLFQVYDVDGNGFIDYEELRTVLKSCMEESALQLSDSNLDQLTRALFEDADVDKSGTITFEELQVELDKHPGVIENLTIRSLVL